MVHLSNTWVWSVALLSLLGQVNNNEWSLEVCSLMQRDQMHANHVGSKPSCTEKKGTSFRVPLPFCITKIQHIILYIVLQELTYCTVPSTIIGTPCKD